MCVFACVRARARVCVCVYVRKYLIESEGGSFFNSIFIVFLRRNAYISIESVRILEF